jgi:hypothetical protein
MPNYALVEANIVRQVVTATAPPDSRWIMVTSSEGYDLPVEPGWAYSAQYEAFVAPLWPSWRFEPITLTWIPPEPAPEWTATQMSVWNEQLQKWDLVDIPQPQE